jgi:hypothetical protein
LLLSDAYRHGHVVEDEGQRVALHAELVPLLLESHLLTARMLQVSMVLSSPSGCLHRLDVHVRVLGLVSDERVDCPPD